MSILVLALIIGALPFILMVAALIDILRHEFEPDQNKIIWVLVVIFLPLLGSLLYFLIGSNQKK
jgi:beta-lactamase regulating signal transducer with metallopeptidase domain